MINMPQRPLNDRVIWRYLSLDKYLDLLVTKSIKFTQLAIAVDKLEVSLMLNRLESQSLFTAKKSVLEGARHHVEQIKKSHYISCWAGKDE